MTRDLWQQDDDTIEIFLDRATRRLMSTGVIPTTDDAQDSPRYESSIENMAEELFNDENL